MCFSSTVSLAIEAYLCICYFRIEYTCLFLHVTCGVIGSWSILFLYKIVFLFCEICWLLACLSTHCTQITSFLTVILSLPIIKRQGVWHLMLIFITFALNSGPQHLSVVTLVGQNCSPLQCWLLTKEEAFCCRFYQLALDVSLFFC